RRHTIWPRDWSSDVCSSDLDLELEVRIVPSDLYYSNKIHHLLEGEDAADVYMSGPVLVWEHQAAGFVQPLDEFLERADDGYDARSEERRVGKEWRAGGWPTE